MIRYIVFNQNTNQYYRSRYNTTPNIEKAKLYIRKSDAEYRQSVLSWHRQRKNNNWIVLEVEIQVRVVNAN